MSDLYHKKLSSSNYVSLLEAGSKAFDSYKLFSVQQAHVEEMSRDQAHCKIWHRMRAGMVTASRFKAACCTDPANPSLSLITAICHPELAKFKTEATKWGCLHESTAKQDYIKQQKQRHSDFSLSSSGLHISKEYRWLAATPDGLIQCNCCGSGLCEIKCPFCHRNRSSDDAVSDKKFCLKEVPVGTFQLKHNHDYYYQVQAQLLCTNKVYCDFVVWTKSSLHVERIVLDEDFLKENIPKAREFVEKGILPELLGRWYSRAAPPTIEIKNKDESDHQTTTNNDTSPDQFCYCRQGEHGTMVMCDNPGCVMKWFYLTCLKLKSKPRAKKWHCPDCRKCKTTKLPYGSP